MRRILFSVGVAICVALAVRPRPGLAQPPELRIGQAVEARGTGIGINLRRDPGLASRLVGTVLNGTTMVVTGGPASADGVVWWEIDGPSGWGWAAEGGLRPARSVWSNSAAAAARCVPAGPAYGAAEGSAGIFHCLRPGGVHVVVIDLNDPHVRFETVLAHDAPDVSSLSLESVPSMAARYPGAVGGINGDYFSEHSGPEGLTIKNGQRLDTLTSMDRSAIVIGQAPLDAPGAALPIPAAIMRLARLAGRLDPATFYNAVGGGPQVVTGGTWEWERGWGHPLFRGCPFSPLPEDVINGECFPNTEDWQDPLKLWTAVGLTPHHRMIWAVGPHQHIAPTMAAFGVATAIKLDSGSSSQLWYQRTQVDGYRPVASGLLVFYVGSARVVAQTRWPVLVERDALHPRVVLENTGGELWTAGEYALVREAHGPGAPERVPLPRDVAPGDRVTLEWMAAPVETPGVQASVWRLARREAAFPGEPIIISAVVLPGERAAEASQLRDLVRQWLASDPASVETRVRAYLAGSR